jgi:glycine oxidase
VVGATVAWELSSAGVQVQLLDARTPGAGATRASAGVLCPYIEGHAASALRELGRESLDQYDDFIARVARDSGEPLIYERAGTLEVALDAEEAERLAAASGALWRDGVEARWLPAAVIADLEPNVTTAAAGALFIPIHGHVGVTALTRAAVTAAVRRGTELTSDTGVIHVHAISGGGVRVVAGPREWEADLAVLAAGSWSSRITVDGVDPLPVKPIRGQLLQLAATAGTVRRPIWGDTGYLVPWPDGTVLVGATVEDVGFDESSTEPAQRALLATAATLVPALAQAALVQTRVGLRPKGPDDLPWIGRSAAIPGLIYATGHYRNGVLLAPLTAALVRRLATDSSAQTLPVLDPHRHFKA